MRLNAVNLNKTFGGIVALKNVTLEFSPGAVVAVIGPNGAGKTTLFNVIGGYLRPDSGHISLHDVRQGLSPSIEITGFQPHEIAEKGIGMLFQDVRVFERLSVLDNVATAAKGQYGENPWTSLLRPSRVRERQKEVLEAARAALEYVGLNDSMHLCAGQLSYGQQKLLAIARLLAGDFRVLLLDEPTSGIHPDMVTNLLGFIQRLAHDDGRTVAIIEHSLDVVRRIGDQVCVMVTGEVLDYGSPCKVLNDATLREVFPEL